MTAYYNEIEPFAAEWLRNLIAAGHIASGEVDERSIVDVAPDDLRGFTQCHFFAGIGLWSLALRWAGWADDRPVWTGSCPCQPFSSAGSGKQFDDDRHLWPAWVRLIEACRPPVVFGEQVASALAIGKRPPADLQRLRERRDALGFLKDWMAGNAPEPVQGVSEPGFSQPTSRTAHLDLTPRQSSFVGGEGPGEETRPSLHNYESLGREEAGHRDLRSDGPDVRSDREARMEHAVTRPDRSGCRLHEEEHPDGTERAERRLRELGRGSNSVSGASAFADARLEVERAHEGVVRKVEGANEYAWVDHVFADLERAHYALGPVASPACGYGAPQIRLRLYFAAYDLGSDRESRMDHPDQGRHDAADGTPCAGRSSAGLSGRLGALGGAGRVGHDKGHPGNTPGEEGARGQHGLVADRSRRAGELANIAGDGRREKRALSRRGVEGNATQGRAAGSEQRGDAGFVGRIEWPGPVNGFWRDADWLHCRDGRWRPARSGSFPLAHGCASRVGRLRAYGNGIVPQQAAEVIKAFMECAP